MSLAFVGITLNIRNNTTYPIRINVLGSPFNPLDTVNAKTEYRWDITAFNPSDNDVLTLEYKPVGAAVFSTFTYQIYNTNIQGLISALDALGIGYFQSYTELGQLYLSTYNDNNVFGLLTITNNGTPATSTTTTTTTGAPTTSTTTTTTTGLPTTSTTTTTTTLAPTTTTSTTTTTTAAPTTSTTTTTTTAAPTTSTTTTSTTAAPTSTTTTTTTAAPITSTTTTSTTAAPTSTTTTTTTAAPTTSTTTTTTTAVPTTSTTTSTTTPAFSLYSLTYNNGDFASSACDGNTGNVGPFNYYTASQPLANGTILYSDSALTTPASNGYYSNSIFNWEITDSLGTLSNQTSCSGTTTSTTTTTTTIATTSSTTTTTTLAPATFILGFATSNPNDACYNGLFDTNTYYSTNGSVLGNGLVLYNDSALTTLVSNGWYSDGSLWYVVNTGNGTLTNQTACALTTTTTSTTTSTTTPAFSQYSLTYNNGDFASSACDGNTGNVGPFNYYTAAQPLANGSILYSDSALTTPANNGYYSNSIFNWDITDSLGTLSNETSCGGTTTTTSTTTSTTTAALIANIDITNGSLDVSISQVVFNGVIATLVGGTLPNTTGNGTSLNTTEIGTYTLDVYRSNSVAGQHITVTDSNGTIQCIAFGNGSGVESYSGVVYDGITNIQIDAQDGPC